MGLRPPFWMVIGVQVMSTIGDSFGQRCSRVDHKGSRRHFLISLVLMTAAQMLVICTIVQLAFPGLTSVVYVKPKGEEASAQLTCYKEIDMQGHFGRNCTMGCTEITCPSQGPLSMPRSLSNCPTLWLNNFVDIIYYLGEILLYKEPYGLVLLVVSALTSSLIIKPVGGLLGQQSESVPWPIMLLGVTGCLFCVFEKPPKSEKKEIELDGADEGDKEGANMESPTDNNTEDRKDDGASNLVVEDGVPSSWSDDKAEPLLERKKDGKEEGGSLVLKILYSCRLTIPFTMLSIAYGVYFVMQKYYNDECHVNAWGYNSIDQVLLPLYIFPFIVLVDLIKPLKMIVESGSDRDESFLEAMKLSWKEASLFNLFMYRGFINARAIAYTYFAVKYDLNQVYLELTLVRVILSWMGSLVLTLVIPKFINATSEESSILKNPLNIFLKIVGTVFITGSLVWLQLSSK